MITVSVIVPCYNEKTTVIELLQSVNRQDVGGFRFQVIVVDDGSTDGTLELLEDNSHLYAKLIRMPKNGGKGAAVRAGLEVSDGDYILFQDADLEYDPDDYGKLVAPIRKLNADLIIGSRMLGADYTRVVYFWHKVGNWFITNTFNLIYNTTFTDIYSCYLLYRRELVNPTEITSTGWEQHAEILGVAVKRAKTMYDVPVKYDGRTYDEGKKIRAHHIISVIRMIFISRFRR